MLLRLQVRLEKEKAAARAAALAKHATIKTSLDAAVADKGMRSKTDKALERMWKAVVDDTAADMKAREDAEAAVAHAAEVEQRATREAQVASTRQVRMRYMLERTRCTRRRLSHVLALMRHVVCACMSSASAGSRAGGRQAPRIRRVPAAADDGRR